MEVSQETIHSFELQFAEVYNPKRLEELGLTFEQALDQTERLAIQHGLSAAQISEIQWKVVQAINTEASELDIQPRRPKLSPETLKRYKKLYKEHMIFHRKITNAQDLIDLQEAIKYFTDKEIRQIEREIQIEIKSSVAKALNDMIAANDDSEDTKP